MRIPGTLLLFFLSAPLAHASLPTPPETVRVAETELRLKGTHLMEATLLKVDIFFASYYEAPESAAARPKRLRLHFLKSVPAAKIIGKWSEKLRENCQGKCPWIDPAIADIKTFFGEIESGDLLELDFFAGRVAIGKNGKASGEVRGAEFAKGFLEIWVGSRPVDKDMAANLLKRK